MNALRRLITPECAHHMPLDSVCMQRECIHQSETNPSTRSNTMSTTAHCEKHDITTHGDSATGCSKCYREARASQDTKAIPAIGEYWPGQGGVRVATMRGQNGQPDYELILPTDPSTRLDDREWGKYGQKIEGADHMNDGVANTAALAAAGNEVAQAIQGMEAEGHKDLHWPSKGEMAAIQMNTPELLEKGELYWSSTQCSSGYAWYQSFDVGNSGIDLKDSTLRVCAVRRFVIPSPI